ncbi:hypothetical protein PINS_up014233 [Pythium insidiosum]|nr:hypothetical protein PINS_up014233 [Pythium insidiosum]
MSATLRAVTPALRVATTAAQVRGTATVELFLQLVSWCTTDDYTERAPRHDRGYDDRGGYRSERRAPRGGHDGAERQRTPVPDQAPFKIYVGNLPFSMHEDDLADLFGRVDVVDVRIPRDRDSDRPKGLCVRRVFDPRGARGGAAERRQRA